MRVETTTIGELPELHKMGHTCANLNGELFFVWGGTDDQLAAARQPHVWIYETLTGYWRRRSCSGDCPPQLSGSASTLIGRQMFVFGGHSTAHDNWLNSLYCLDLDTFQWSDLGSQARAEPTKPIRSDKCVCWTFEGRLYVFGGYGWSQTEHLLELLDRQRDLQLAPDQRWPKFGWNNQLVEYDPRTSTWRWPSYSGSCPSARAAHSGALVGFQYYLFGGRDCRERLNDLYVLDMQSFVWTQIVVVADPLALSLAGRAPIGHLLEDAAEQSAALDDDDDDDDDDEHDDHDSNHSGQEQQQQPQPTTSSRRHSDRQLSVADCATTDSNDERDDNDDTDDEHDGLSGRANCNKCNLNHLDSSLEENADADEPADRAREYPSHLLERWSLASSRPMSSHLSDLNCERHQQAQQSELQQHQQSEQLAELDNERAADSAQDNELVDSRNAVDERLANNNSNNNDDDHDDNNIAGADRDQLAGERMAGEQAPDEPANSREGAGEMPIGRSFASFTPIAADKILLFGGISTQGKNLDDCWLFDTKLSQWTQVDLRHRHPRLWHSGARTKYNEVVVMGGSCSDKVDEFCSDVLTISLEAKSLKRLALDTVARSIRMRSISKARDRLPSTICKLIKLRKQAMALTLRRSHRFQQHHQQQPQPQPQQPQQI